MKNLTNEAVRAAIDDCLSGVDALPSVRAQVLNQVRGEVKVKKKFSVGIIFALVACLLMAATAVAAGLGLFGQIGEQPNADARLAGLEKVSMAVEEVFNVGNGVTVTVHQAYYDGSRVFISYSMEGPHDVLETGTGDPGIVNYDRQEPGLFAMHGFVDGANGQQLMAWLDGSEPRWATRHVVNVPDGLQIGDEYLDIIGGEFYYMEDGTLMSWKECEVPAELAADEVTFSIGVFTNKTTYYQTPEYIYTSYLERGEATWYDFTVKKSQDSVPMTGSAEGEGWIAEATLTATAIDIKGKIVVKCPQSWVEIERTWSNPEKIDSIYTWVLYAGGEKVNDSAVEGVNPSVDGQLTYDIGCMLEDASQELKLVPVYNQSGEHMDEAIVLKVAE